MRGHGIMLSQEILVVWTLFGGRGAWHVQGFEGSCWGEKILSKNVFPPHNF